MLGALAFLSEVLPQDPTFYRELGLWGVFLGLVVPWLKRGGERLIGAQVALVEKQRETLDSLAGSVAQQTLAMEAVRLEVAAQRSASEESSRKLELLCELLRAESHQRSN